MASKFIIPSVFTAVDQLSPKMAVMRHNVIDFGTRAEASIARADRAFRRLTPGLGAAQKQLLGMVGTGAAVASAFQLGRFSFNSLTSFEEDVDSFRTIVSDLNDTEFSEFEREIGRVAKSAKVSSVQVAQAFGRIAGLNADLADTAGGLGEVSEAAIILAKASKMDLGVAAENLVGIMNQFSFGAGHANRTINALAAGQAVGAASITQTAEAFTVFGSVAAGANISLEQSVGLIQALGKFSLFGAEAGTKLRGAILRLQRAGVGYVNGQFSFNDALEQTNAALAGLRTEKEKDAVINKMFGAENVTAGRILLKNVELIKEFTQQVTGTAEAQKAAEINTGNLRGAVNELSDAWVNYLTASEGSRSGIDRMTSATRFLTRNLDTIVDTTIAAVKWYAIIKGSLFAARAAMTAWNVTLGISSVLQRAYSVSLAGNTTALAARAATLNLLSVSTKGATASQIGLNAAMAANPVGILTLGIGALATGIGYLIYQEKQLSAEYERQISLRVAQSYEAEGRMIDALTKKLMALGQSYEEATKNALEFERRSNLQTQAELSSEIESLRGKREGIKGGQMESLTDMFVPLQMRVDRVTDQILAKQALLTDAMAQGRRITDRAIGFSQAPAVQAPLVADERQKFTTRELVKFFEQPSAPAQKSDITVRIHNDSDNEVTVSHGRTKIADVQPKTTSTKQLRENYAR